MKELLINTRRILEKGWMQGAYESDGAYCVRGAFNQAIAETGGMGGIFHATEAVRNHPDVLKHHGIVSWNDHPDTDHAEVLRVFDEVIASV